MKRARRRPYVSLIPRKPGSAYLLWNLGRALASSPSTVEIHVGYFDGTDCDRFVLLKRIGPPQVSGGTFVYLGDNLGDRRVLAMIVQKSSVSAAPHGIIPGDVYATSRPIQLVRSHPCSNIPRFVAVTYQYPKPLRVDPIPEELTKSLRQLRLSQGFLEQLRSRHAGSSYTSSTMSHL